MRLQVSLRASKEGWSGYVPEMSRRFAERYVNVPCAAAGWLVHSFVCERMCATSCPQRRPGSDAKSFDS